MASFYTVVQYLPDPIIDERINIGVIVYSDHELYSRFLGARSWGRVRTFGEESISFLRDFAAAVNDANGDQLLLPELGAAPRLNQATLERMAGAWINSIQFTPPRASTKLPKELLADVGTRFLRTAQTHQPKARGRQYVREVIYAGVRDALNSREERLAREYLRRNESVLGFLDYHKFDVVVRNGKPIFAAHGLSFQTGDEAGMKKEVDSAAWAVDDVRKKDDSLPLAIVVLPPQKENRIYNTARKVFKELGAEVIVDTQVDKWANTMALRVPVAQ